ncbi:tetratricopeptide repeat protein [Rhodobacteraceae bacterium N5(2021)]|uniref:Tetratricopeptide repeat protein n=1 Tax=Gymnodinialimonas phycosphaerae TaxID=2841589 RepID=A0A975TT94_9RHOB|nr:tetratricopeptide repeat protein [Gymnodinialimonas phycosphaerae]MBY4894566.1 tetratricopeptide repeat protein [Gymnodinialimonas phycosphaerae]
MRVRSSVFALATMAMIQPVTAHAEGLAGAYLAGRAAAISGDHAQAAAYFDRALLLDPGNPFIVSNAVFAHAALAEWEQAAAVAEGLPEGADGQELVALVQFVRHVAEDDLQAAIDMIEAGNGPGPLANDLARAWLTFGQGDMSGAVDLFEALASERGLEELAALHLALARAAVGDFEAAHEILSGATGVQITNTERVVRARAVVMLQLDMRAEALDLLDGYTQAVPDPGLLALQAQVGSGETIPYDFVITAQDGVAEVFFTVAQLLSGDRNTTLSLLMAQAAQGIDADHTDAMVLAGELMSASEQFQQAAVTFAAVPEGDPNYIEAQMGRAEALEDLGQQEEAIAILAALAEARPDLASVQAAYGDILRRAERFEEAIDAYTAVLSLVDTDLPRYWFIYYARAISYHQIDNWDPAEADFRRALELNPEQPNVLNYLGYSLVEQRRNFDEALDMIQRAVAARPESGYIIDSLGWVYYRLGRFDEAVAPMERAVELEPNDPIVNDHLGDVYWVNGRYREAEFQWHRALSFNPEPDEAARIRRKLDVGLYEVLEEEGGVGALTEQ